MSATTAMPASPLRPLGLTRAEFVEAARAAGRRAGSALDEYRALFRDGVVPAWCTVPDHPITATLVEGETSKFVLRLTDEGYEGLETESVLIPMPRSTGTTTTLCVSSQVGCAMGCRFCETAQMGLIRNLRADQIVHQWWAATHRVQRSTAQPVQNAVKNPVKNPVKNIVFMGMGEPTDNIDAVISAIRVLVDHDGAQVPASNISISTVGNPDGIVRIGELVRERGFHRLNLALSLNAPNDEIRSQIMPVNKAWPMARLKEALLAFPRYSQAAFCVEYVLIPGVNDADEHCDEVCAFLREIRCSLNVIPYNPRRNSPWPAPDERDVERFVARAVANGQFTKRRGTKGRNVMAACGQLGNERIRNRREVCDDGSTRPVALRVPIRGQRDADAMPTHNQKAARDE
ncbi:MAG: radical SAM protein [bacterium]